MKRDEHYNNNISNILARIAWYYGGPILARAHPPFRGFHNDWERFGHALSYVHRRAGEDVHRHANCRGINTCTWLHNYQSLHFTVIHAFLFSIHFLFHHTNQPTNRPINQSINQSSPIHVLCNGLPEPVESTFHLVQTLTCRFWTEELFVVLELVGAEGGDKTVFRFRTHGVDHLPISWSVLEIITLIIRRI